MVAGSDHHLYVITWSSAHFWWQQRSCTFYLFPFLMKWQQKHTSLSIIAIGFGILFLFFHKQWMLVPIGMVFVGFLIGNIGELIHHTWMMIAKILGFINSRLLLSISFFIILTPIALLMRLLKKGSFQKTVPNRNSVFTARNHEYSKTDLANPF